MNDALDLRGSAKLPVFRLFRAAFRLMVRNIGWLLLFLVAAAAVPGVVVVAGAAIIPRNGIQLSPLAFLALLPAILVPMIICAAAIDLLYRRYRGGPAAPGRAIMTGARLLLALIGLQLLLLLLGCGAALFVALVAHVYQAVVPLMPGGLDAARLHIGIMAVGGLLAFVVAVPVLILLSAVALLALIACIVEKCGPIGGLERAVELLQGNCWRVIAAFVLLAIVSGVLVAAPQLALAAAAQSTAVVTAVLGVLGIVTGVFVQFFAGSFYVTLFGMMRDLQEGSEPPFAASVHAG